MVFHYYVNNDFYMANYIDYGFDHCIINYFYQLINFDENEIITNIFLI